MKQPKISIIVPIYKAEDSIRRLLDSFEKQPCQDIEFFLIDNASPDKCGEICKEYVERDSRFTLHTLEVNIGYIRARQYGIDNCAGEYVGFSDSDDYVPEDIYRDVIFAIERDNSDFVICGYCGVYGDKTITYRTAIPEGCYKDEKINEVVMPVLFGYSKNAPFLQGFMWKNFYRKSISIDNGIGFVEELKPYEDQIYNLDFVKCCDVVTVIDKPVYYYVSNENSITGQNVKHFNAIDEYKRVDMLENEKLARDNKKIYKFYIANDMIDNFYPLFLNVAKTQNKDDVDKFVKIINPMYAEYVRGTAEPLSKIHKVFYLLFKNKKYKSLVLIIKFSLKFRG